MGVGSKPVTISLHDDSPHIAVSAGSGAGKSVLAQLIGVQVLARGGQVTILDLKGSHRWALGLPGVDYCTAPEQQHNALVGLARLADQRNSLAFHEAEGWDPGPRHLVICEEMKRHHWPADGLLGRGAPEGQPKTSPAITGLRGLLYMGRSAEVNVVGIAQMLTARAIGGPESRENFAVRCLARYTANAWRMLVPEAAMPRASRTLGRWQVVVGGTATECQVCYLGAAERAAARPQRRGRLSTCPRSLLMGSSLETSTWTAMIMWTAWPSRHDPDPPGFDHGGYLPVAAGHDAEGRYVLERVPGRGRTRDENTPPRPGAG